MFPERLVTDDANDARYIGQTDLRYELRVPRRPPFCLVVDWVAAAIIAVEIVAGVHFHH